jgi:hypothetical protein
LCGEGFEDEVPATIDPYVDVVLDRDDELEDSATIAVNGSGAIQLISDDAGTPLERLQTDWGFPNTTQETIADGTRLISTNGSLPAVVINGETTPANGWHRWALLDSVGPVIISSIGVEHYVLTRGYVCTRPYTLQGGVEAKRFICLALQLATWNPTYTVRTIMQGKGTDAEQVTAETRNRLKYFDQFDKADWDPSNTNDDFNVRGREDYSWEEDGPGMQIGSGVDIDAQQEFCHRVAVNERGLWMQLEITNTQGRLEIIAAAMEAERGEVLSGVAVN